MSELAINGGSPIRKKSFSVWPLHTQKDLDNPSDIYEYSFLKINGEQNKIFAYCFAKYSGVKYCIPVTNNIINIELILKGLGFGHGDEVILPPYTFTNSISSLLHVGVTPIFADIDPTTYNLSAESAEKMITPLTKAIMPFFFGGRPADMDALSALAKKYNLYLIGDAAQAAGSAWKGKNIGSYGIAAAFSFPSSKNSTFSEGGIITTNNDDLYYKITSILNNSQDIRQAGFFDTQFNKMETNIKKRMDNAAYLDDLLKKLPFVSPLAKDERITRNNYNLFLFNLHADILNGVSRERFIKAVNAEGVPLCAGYYPINNLDYIKNIKKAYPPDIPNAEYLSHHECCWLNHSVLLGDHSDMDDIADALVKVYGHLYDLR